MLGLGRERKLSENLPNLKNSQKRVELVIKITRKGFEQENYREEL
jgi:hypothetical protein